LGDLCRFSDNPSLVIQEVLRVPLFWRQRREHGVQKRTAHPEVRIVESAPTRVRLRHITGRPVRKGTMTAAGVPENGDVVIRRDGPNATPSYVISAIPGPDEVACATLAEAVSMARSYAEHARVNLWLARVGNEFTLRVRDPRPTAC